MSKIYTRFGDYGSTKTISGKTVSKSDWCIEANGALDELNANIGLLRHEIMGCQASSDWLFETVDEYLKFNAIMEKIQKKLFAIGSVANCTDAHIIYEKFMKISDDDITQLEENIDQMEANLPELKNFVLPYGIKLTCLTHVVRTVCRRAERSFVPIFDIRNSPVMSYITSSNKGEMEQVRTQLLLCLKYLNRLSDWLFVLARRISVYSNTGEYILENDEIRKTEAMSYKFDETIKVIDDSE
jgi:cob(I)alamin adenosyltransferase